MPRPSVGVIGLATMGANLARNIARHGIPVVVQNRTTAKTHALIDAHGDEGPMTFAESLADLVAALTRPRCLIVMVQAGAPVDAVLDELVDLLDEGDIVVDGGNSRFTDTMQRSDRLAARGIDLLGTGISGGEQGALDGPSIMPGGPRRAYDQVAEVLTTISAQVDGTPCCAYIGTDGAGHYVKMVHNGIEYADLQLIAEAYDLLVHGAGLDAAGAAEVFERWDGGRLESFLVESTATVLRDVDAITGRPLVDVILDAAEQKGTGRWAAQDAMELGVPLSVIDAAVSARSLSSRCEQRARAADVLTGPDPSPSVAVADADAFVDDVEQALLAAKIVAYAQGFEQLAAASAERGWDLDLASLASIWRGGCIIRAGFLDHVREAYTDGAGLDGLLLVPWFSDALAAADAAWRRVVACALQLGVPVPALSAALAHVDGLRRSRGPASLVQGVRDLFGAHGYRRTDQEGTFHTWWAADGDEIRTD